MNFFKKRGVAIVIALCIIWSSTLLSTSIQFGRKCSEITDGFYDGVYSNGYTHPSTASHLKNITGYADGLATIAGNYDIDTEELLDLNDYLKMSLRYSRGDESYIYFCYDDLMKEVRSIENALDRADLSDRDRSGFEQYVSSISGAQSALEDTGYNETVSEFLRKYNNFPTELFADMAGVEMPEYFN